MHKILSKQLILVTAMIALSACNREKTIMVSEFLHNPDLIKTTRAFCNENPAEREALPNCINSNRAGGMRADLSGTCYAHNVIDHACIDNILNKKGTR